jgi:peptidoglycan hydrolase-like protein with peptidoglycan-binding domain
MKRFHHAVGGRKMYRKIPGASLTARLTGNRKPGGPAHGPPTLKEVLQRFLFSKEAVMSDEFTSHGAALDEEGLAQALDLAKVSAAQLWAVLAVETSGNGFYPDRRPKILCERHVFSRLTHQTFDAEHPDISSKTPGNYGASGPHRFSYRGTPDLRIRMAQTCLTYLGWHPGAVDGIVGKQTRDAINLFQAKEHLDITTVLDDETLACLRSRVEALPL